MTIKVGWSIYNDPEWDTISQWKELVYFEPEPLWPMVMKERDVADYLRCPSVVDYCKNTYVVRCPYDITISHDTVRDSFYTDSLGDDWMKQTFFPRFPIRKDNKTISACITLRIKYLFVADEDLEIEVSDVPIIATPLTANIKIIPGIMNIHKWVRPVDFTFEIQDLTKPLVLRRGDPLFAVRFKTEETIKMTHIEMTDDLKNVALACTISRNFVPNKSLKYRYEMAKRYLKNKRWL
jgi:hypothetical protein